MKLQELENYNPITIQCHDNPDADTLASGFGLYSFFLKQGKQVALVYAGRSKIQKTNLKLMTEKLHIPITYLEAPHCRVKGLLITVDCQYGAGNVTYLEADEVAVIDHHQIEGKEQKLSEIRSNLGSCSTLVWKMMTDAGYDFTTDYELGTALYYGLFSDTNQFAEIYNPLDMDMRDAVLCQKSLINMFKNSNLSLQELELAGIALIKHIFNENYHYAIIRAYPCDPNILGLISDFLLQVDNIYTCVVYNELDDGIKFSVRSCVKEVHANELAAFLAEGIGSGGGHSEKAGGFIQHKKYAEKYPQMHSEAFFSDRMNEYFRNCTIIDSENYAIDIAGMKPYVKKKLPVGYVVASDVLPVNTPITIRTLEGDMDMVVEPDLIIMIGIKGEVYPNRREKFERNYAALGQKYAMDGSCGIADYVPTIRNRIDGAVKVITDYAHVCIPKGETHIHAKQLDHMVKVFTAWDKEKYMLGKEGDYLAVRCDDLKDIYVVEKDIFYLTYDEMK